MSADTVDTNLLAVNKQSIEDYNSFVSLLKLYSLYIFNEEQDYYILDGRVDDLNDFSNFWNS